MSALDKLLSPYRQAVSGQATSNDYLRQDPIYSTLFPAVVSSASDARVTGQGAPSSLKALARRLEAMGFDVGELEGFQGEGQISSGHADNSLHYDSRAFDVNYSGGGRWGNENKALSWLANWLRKRYEPQELFYPGHDPVGGHDSHLHFGL